LLLISIHGFSDAQRRRVQDANRELLDPSCLRLRHIFRAALELQAEGRRVLLIGNSGDAEVQRIVEQLVNGDVIEHPHDVRCWESRELGIVCQGSVPPAVFAEICSHIQLCNPLADIRMVDTVQDPVQRRQRVLRELLGMVDAVVVAGERDSSNIPRIVQLCHEHLTPAVHVGCADELDPEWFGDVETVGLTVGGATTADTIDRVRHRLEEIVAKRRG
jgi:4-hydroxy-3-methylbut-2-enyl diphosphate reductase